MMLFGYSVKEETLFECRFLNVQHIISPRKMMFYYEDTQSSSSSYFK